MSFIGIFEGLCLEIGLSPSAVLDQIGISKSSYTNWKGGMLPSNASKRKIARYFNVPVSYFITPDPGIFPGKAQAEFEQQKRTGVNIPVLGKVIAGIPISAIEDIVGYEEIPIETAQRGEFFALEVKGRSMEPKFSPGDVVIVRNQCTIESGEIAIVIVDGEDATIKHIKHTDEGIVLLPRNPAYDPIFYSNAQIEELPVIILGKVVELRAKF